MGIGHLETARETGAYQHREQERPNDLAVVLPECTSSKDDYDYYGKESECAPPH